MIIPTTIHSFFDQLFSLFASMAIFAAYIDPNTGGMLFQVLAVLFGVISGLFLFFSGRIKGAYYKFRRKISGTKEEPAGLDSQEEPTEHSN